MMMENAQELLFGREEGSLWVVTVPSRMWSPLLVNRNDLIDPGRPGISSLPLLLAVRGSYGPAQLQNMGSSYLRAGSARLDNDPRVSPLPHHCSVLILSDDNNVFDGWNSRYFTALVPRCKFKIFYIRWAQFSEPELRTRSRITWTQYTRSLFRAGSWET